MSDEHDHAVAEELADGQPEGCEPAGELSWIVATDNFRLLSVDVNVRSCDEEVSARLRWHLEPFLHRKHEAGALMVDLYPLEASDRHDRWYAWHLQGDEPRSGPMQDLLNHAVWQMHALVPQRAGDFLFLHAGAVVRDGAAMLLPAVRDAGKSTTVAGLLEAGFSYLSDELGAIDPITVRAYPFPKRISLDDASLRFFPGLSERLSDREGVGRWLYQRYVRPEDLGSTTAPATRITSIVFLAPEHEGPPRLEPVSQAEAVHEMAAQCFNLYRYEGRGVILLSRIASEARAYRLSGGTPQERAALLADRAADPA